MAYEIHDTDGIFEVYVSGRTTTAELLDAVRELRARDPRKEARDLWVMSEESVVPIAAFGAMAESIQEMCPADVVGNKTAIVGSNLLHQAALEIYRSEAVILPFEVQVFSSRDEALEWLRS